MSSEERKGLLYVALAAALFSTSPVLIRWADPLHPFIKTWARMLIGAVAVYRAGVGCKQLGRDDSLPCAGSGTGDSVRIVFDSRALRAGALPVARVFVACLWRRPVVASTRRDTLHSEHSRRRLGLAAN